MTKQLKQKVKNSVFGEMDRLWEGFKKDSNKFIKKLKKKGGKNG
jgi:hypothetical protein